MHNARLLPFLALALLPLHACQSVDAERSELRQALADASGLSVEISGWQQRSDNSPTETVVDTIDSFQTRADHILGTISGISHEATTGVDLAGVTHALTEIVEFDTSRVADASQTGRASIIQQFGQLAESLGRAVGRAGRV